MMTRLVVVLVGAGLVAAFPGCTRSAEEPAQGQPVTQAASSQTDTDTATVVLPAGNPQAGRQAFLDLKCTVCHRVAGESAFPAPVSSTQGPDLDHTLALRSVSDVADAIVMPSHLVSVRITEEVKKQIAGMSLSPMGDFADAITIRQLANLLAYLRSREAPR